MKCPECKNKDFKQTHDVKYPIQNLGGKERYDTVDVRRYCCMQCGFRFKTHELFAEAIQAKVNREQPHESGSV